MSRRQPATRRRRTAASRQQREQTSCDNDSAEGRTDAFHKQANMLMYSISVFFFI